MWGEETAGAETQGDKNPDLFTVGGNVTGVATMKNSMDAPQKVKNSMYVCMYDPAVWSSNSHFWVYIQKKWKQATEEKPALPCLWQHYSQQPRYGNNLSVCQQMNG